MSVFESKRFWGFLVAAAAFALYMVAVFALQEESDQSEISRAEFDERVANEVRIGANNLVTEIKIPKCSEGWTLDIPITKGWNLGWSFKAKWQYKWQARDREWREAEADGRFLGEVLRFCIEPDNAQLANTWQKLNWERPNPHRPGWVKVPSCDHDFGNRWSRDIDIYRSKAKRVEWPKEWQISINMFDGETKDWVERQLDYLDVSREARKRWGDSFSLCTSNKAYGGYAMPLTWID